MNKEKIYKEELEEIIGTLYRGDMTVMVYTLLKDTNDISSLLEYLTGERPESNSGTNTEKIIRSPSFEDWFNTCTEIK